MQTGTMANPFTGWLLLRSLETVSVRMRRQAKTATKLARLLTKHPKVRNVYYPGLLEPGTNQHAVFSRQCTGPGSLIAFEVEGGVRHEPGNYRGATGTVRPWSPPACGWRTPAS